MMPQEREHLAEVELGLDPDLIARFLAREQLTARPPEMERGDRDDRARPGADSSSVSHLTDSGPDAEDKAECQRADEATDIREKADALRAYLKRAREAEGQFAQIKLQPEHKSCELLSETAASEARATVARPAEQSPDAGIARADLGADIHEDECSHLQQVASAPTTDQARPERLRWSLIAVGIAVGMFAAMSLWIALG